VKRIEKNEDECGTRAKLGQRSYTTSKQRTVDSWGFTAEGSAFLVFHRWNPE